MSLKAITGPLSVVCAFSAISFIQLSVAQQPPSVGKLSPEQVAQLQAKADAGDPEAEVNLGKAYQEGNGVPQSDMTAVKWYRAAAEKDNAKAQNYLGLMFRLGRGVEGDKVEAVRWYRKAARQKNAVAMFNLGTAYYNGDGVDADNTAAFSWFLLAQDLGSSPASDPVERMNEEVKDLRPEALERIGDMYEKGDDLPLSHADALSWYRKAVENGSAAVQMKLAGLLLQGRGGPPNYLEIDNLCESAARQHYSSGTYCLGVLYQAGLGVSQDFSKAAKRFNEAADLGYPAAMLKLGEMYWKGEGVKQDKISAYEFLVLASTSGLAEAKQQKENLEKQLNPKELKRGQAKASEWARTHRPLVLFKNGD